MKLHELDWDTGKEYIVTTQSGFVWEVYVSSRGLVVKNDNEKLYNKINLATIALAEFTEIVKPVTFLEAYQHCLDNGVDYVSTCGVFKLQKLSGDVQLRFTRGCHDMVGMTLDKIKWVKVSK